MTLLLVSRVARKGSVEVASSQVLIHVILKVPSTCLHFPVALVTATINDLAFVFRIHFLSDDLSALDGSVFVLRSHSEVGFASFHFEDGSAYISRATPAMGQAVGQAAVGQAVG